MKPKLIDRILLALLLIATLALSLLLIGLASRVAPLDNLEAFLALLYTGLNNQLILGAAGLVILLITLRLMFAGSGKKPAQPNSTLVQATDLGATFISLSAIDGMVQKHCRANNRVRNVASQVNTVREGGVTVRVRLSLMPDTEVPALCKELQQSLKEYVEKGSGINVREIGILVEDTSSNPKSRVD